MIVKLLQWLRRGIFHGRVLLVKSHLPLLIGIEIAKGARHAGGSLRAMPGPRFWTGGGAAADGSPDSDFDFIRHSQSVHVLSLLPGEGFDLSGLSETVSAGLDSSFDDR